MRTETITRNIYKFNELTEDAKENAINEFREQGVDVNYIYDEAYNTVKEFHKYFPTKEGNRSWLNTQFTCEDNILELTGERLRKYLINNFYSALYSRKYLGSIGKNKVINHRMSETHYYNMSKGAICNSSNFIYSNIQFNNDCTLTGVCYDYSLLRPIYDFINEGHIKDSFKYLNFEMLINDCFESLEKDIKKEVEYLSSEEAIIETIEANDYEFNEEGELI